jgi:D-glycero-alpha-D-manno-heptose-7-phosphate kinase
VIARRAHASAPVRIDFAGAWTDVPPFSVREGGRVISAAIALQVHVNVLPGGEGVHLVSDDLGTSVTIAEDGTRTGEGSVPLLEAAARRWPPGPATITSRADVPQGSGLGSSGAFGVAVTAALAHARGEKLSATELAHLAWELETRDASIPGGKQDQYMAALGGFQDLTFRDPDVGHHPIAVDREFAAELARSLVLCWTGASRLSGGTISRVMQAYERGEPGISLALFGLRDAADAMLAAFTSGDISAVGAALDANWRHQQALDARMRTPGMASLEARARQAGAIGAKAAGSGAGGCMVFLAPGRELDVAMALEAEGGSLLPVEWSWEGVRSW